ncbi:hypothetical protein M885DRAFT_514859 [Pelagophyceae sp. CCMP2097]|nr:hypothetical protein M885DRAFT_514859 [Pelagophyceae sp. CCMP2097]
MAESDRTSAAGLLAAASSCRQTCHATNAPLPRCRSSSTANATLLPVPQAPVSQKSLSVEAASPASQASKAVQTQSRVPRRWSRSWSARNVEWSSATSVAVGLSATSFTRVDGSASPRTAAPRPVREKRRRTAATSTPGATPRLSRGLGRYLVT